jgi:hypothetical protein
MGGAFIPTSKERGMIIAMTLLWQTLGRGAVQLTAAACEDAGRSLLITCLAFDVAAVIIGVLLKWLWDRRHLWSPGARLGISLLITVVLSTVLVAWNPLKNEALLNCLASAQFSRFVVMSHVSDIPRGLVLGGAVAAALYFVVVIVMGLLAKGRTR